MKKIFFCFLCLSLGYSKAQSYTSINDLLDRVEREEKINNNTELYSIAGKKFVLIKDTPDKTQRYIVELKEDTSTLIEIEDDKNTGESVSKIYSGDVLRKRDIVSIRADKLEGKKIGMPVVYTFVLNFRKNIWYLTDANTGERWIETHYLEKK